ncbi:hypothetical protein F170042I7_20590 [Blautia caecimuris]|uniref:hypothetical protein n=1 Tax=Blautia caecimuris TaxID=1796615 RepID=UPI0034B87984
MDKWNETVNIDDDVYILGDVSWHNVTKTIGLLNNLNGNKHLVVGNHDKKFLKNRDFREQFVEVTNYKEIALDDREKMVLYYVIIRSPVLIIIIMVGIIYMVMYIIALNGK